MAPGDVVDEVREPLRHPAASQPLDELVDVHRRTPRVERTPQARLGESVDGRRAGGLDIGHHRQLPPDVRQQRAGGDGGQVRLDEDVFDRLGSAGARAVLTTSRYARAAISSPARAATAVSASSSARPADCQRAAAGHTEELRLDKRPGVTCAT